jgi:hypothetical protein
VALVLDPVETEHARADHLRGGEPRIVHGERRRVAHRRQDQVVAGDEPAIQARQPGHGLGGAQARQHGMGVAVQLLQRDRRTQREGRASLSVCGLHVALIVP